MLIRLLIVKRELIMQLIERICDKKSNGEQLHTFAFLMPIWALYELSRKKKTDTILVVSALLDC